MGAPTIASRSAWRGTIATLSRAAHGRSSSLSSTSCRRVHVEARLADLKLHLPAPVAPAGSYVPAVRTGNLIFLAGHLPWGADGKIVAGKVGQDLDVSAGYATAKLVALGLLATLKNELGDLDRIKRVVKVTGLVNCDASFTQHPQVINGCSDLLVTVLGDQGKHARVAAGYSSLPMNAAVEVDVVVEIAEGN